MASRFGGSSERFEKWLVDSELGRFKNICVRTKKILLGEWPVAQYMMFDEAFHMFGMQVDGFEYSEHWEHLRDTQVPDRRKKLREALAGVKNLRPPYPPLNPHKRILKLSPNYRQF